MDIFLEKCQNTAAFEVAFHLSCQDRQSATQPLNIRNTELLHLLGHSSVEGLGGAGVKLESVASVIIFQ